MSFWIIYEETNGQTGSGTPLFTQCCATQPTPPAGYGVLAAAANPGFGPGDTIVNGALVAYVPTLTDAKTAKTALAETTYAGKIAAGFTYGGTLYQIDTDSQAQIAAMGVMALGSVTDSANSPWPAGFYWIATDNSHVAMDAPTMYAFGRAVAGYVSACILQLRALNDAINAAADQTSLDAIDVTAGYPPPIA